jgi:hypothetical protein
VSVFRVLVGCALIIGGIWETAVSLRYLKTARGQSELAKAGGESRKWQRFSTLLIQVSLGVLLVGNWVENGIVRLLLGITSGAMLTWLVSSDLTSWRRSRQERKQNKPEAEHAWFLTRFENSPFAHRTALAVEDWEALQDRKASLDKRVENGELTSETAARYLAAHRRTLIGSLGYDRPSRWPERMLVSAILPLLAGQARRSDSRAGISG